MSLTINTVRGFKIAYPTFVEVDYTKQLTLLAAKIQFATLKYLNNHDFNLSVNVITRLDDIVDDIDSIIKNINTAISLEVIKVIRNLSKHFNELKRFVDNSFNHAISHLAKHPITSNIYLTTFSFHKLDIKLLKKMWIEKNTALIKDIPINVLRKIKDTIYNAVASGQSMTYLQNKLAEVFKISEKKAKVIARDQIAKLKGQISRYNDLNHGFTMYEWSSCKDGAVRKSHQVLEGKICSWLDPSVYRNKANEDWKRRGSIGGVLKHIGEDYMCRCTNIILCETKEENDLQHSF